MNKDIKLRSFKSSENIQKKVGGPDSSVSNYQFSVLNSEASTLHLNQEKGRTKNRSTALERSVINYWGS